GRGCGWLRAVRGAGGEPRSLLPPSLPEISFNYLGQLDTVFRDSMFEPAPEEFGRCHDPQTRRPFVLDVNATILERQLHVHLTFSSAVFDDSVIARLADEMMHAMRDLVDVRNRSTPSAGFVPSLPADVPLMETIAEPAIVDCFRLSPAQAGFLFHSLLERQSGIYIEQLHCLLPGLLRREAFEQAWRGVIERHSILRTTFQFEENDGHPLQIVHAAGDLECTWYDWQGLSEPEQERCFSEFLREDRRRGFDLAGLPLTRL